MCYHSNKSNHQIAYCPLLDPVADSPLGYWAAQLIAAEANGSLVDQAVG